MKVSATSLSTDRSRFSHVCSAVDIVGRLFLLFTYSEAGDLNILPALS